jgi:DNA-binding XRE family transcriptional regulator
MRAEDIILNAIKKGEFIIDEDGQIWRHRKGKLVRAEHRTPQGYLQIRKMVNNKRYHTGAHRVVWEYFNGRIPDGYIINHKNGQKDDNRPWNLELTTVTENIRHAYKHGLLDQTGQKNPAAKLTDKQVAEIRLAYSGGGYTQEQLAKKYGVSYQCISKIVRGERRRRQPGQTGNYEHLRQRNIVNDPVTGRFVGKKAAGRLLDGREWNEMPEIEP